MRPGEAAANHDVAGGRSDFCAAVIDTLLSAHTIRARHVVGEEEPRELALFCFLFRNPADLVNSCLEEHDQYQQRIAQEIWGLLGNCRRRARGARRMPQLPLPRPHADVMYR